MKTSINIYEANIIIYVHNETKLYMYFKTLRTFTKQILQKNIDY